MKLAVVVQRYGTDINGGAELHARFVAEHLRSHAEVHVLTTCARDYVTWRNEFPQGQERVNGVTVERFRVAKERDALDFGTRSNAVFNNVHSLQDELNWLDSEGPTSPDLLARLRRSGDEFDYVLLFSVRYYHAYHGARIVPGRAILIPTAEREPALGLSMFQPIFRGVRAIMYNSFEEQALIHAVSGNQGVSGVVVGIGSEIPATVSADRARQKFGLRNPFVIYVGRIDANKGCVDLFDNFIRYVSASDRNLDLVLIGNPVLAVPDHPRIKHLGFVGDQDKFDTMAAAELLIMPSYYESLSMVALEAWALGLPVLANAKCDVLLGQCIRSNAGLFYDTPEEFAAVLDRIRLDRALAAALGRNGREYFDRHYQWPVIVRKYLDMFERLRSEPVRTMEPLPGWLGRRKRCLRPAVEVLDELPTGPALGPKSETGAGS